MLLAVWILMSLPLGVLVGTAMARAQIATVQPRKVVSVRETA